MELWGEKDIIKIKIWAKFAFFNDWEANISMKLSKYIRSLEELPDHILIFAIDTYFI